MNLEEKQLLKGIMVTQVRRVDPRPEAYITWRAIRCSDKRCQEEIIRLLDSDGETRLYPRVIKLDTVFIPDDAWDMIDKDQLQLHIDPRKDVSKVYYRGNFIDPSMITLLDKKKGTQGWYRAKVFGKPHTGAIKTDFVPIENVHEIVRKMKPGGTSK